MARRAAETPIKLDAEALKHRIAELTSSNDADHARFGVAVSGGVDSMALLWLAHQAFPGRVLAASVDHGMRSAARDECRLVANFAATLGLPHDILLLDKRPRSQAEAREARYGRLFTWQLDHQIDWLMTAHHADDQLETMVMRLNRGSGISGLAGIRDKRDNLVLRPLLRWRRAELEAVIAAVGIATVDDPSNRDRKYDRARLRASMAGQDFLDPVAAAQSAHHLAQASEAIDWTIGQLAGQRCYELREGKMVNIEKLPQLYRHLLIERIVTAVGGKAPRGSQVEEAMRSVYAGQKVSVAHCTVELSAGEPMSVLIRRAPPRAR